MTTQSPIVFGSKIRTKVSIVNIPKGEIGICSRRPDTYGYGAASFNGIVVGIHVDEVELVPNAGPVDEVSAEFAKSMALDHTKPTNKYMRKVPKLEIDVYDVLTAWNVTNPAVQHAIKKLLQPGQRGHKSLVQDLEEAALSIKRAIELEGGLK